MVQGDQKFKRFLNSIGIIDVESFDMRFLSIKKDPNKDNFFIYDIEKDTPWNFKLVNQFINSLNNIVSYDYKLIFEYKHEIEEIDIISLIKDWYFNHEFKECPFNIHLENHDIIITFINDQDEKDFDKITNIGLLYIFEMTNEGAKNIGSVTMRKEGTYMLGEIG